MAAFSPPPFPEVGRGTLREISRRHNLAAVATEPLPEVGVFNRIYPVGDYLVLRVPRNGPAFVAAALKERVAVPAARAAGVRTPTMVAFDDARDLLPVPYSILERVPGETLGLLDIDPARATEAWRELGRDLALLHSNVPENGPATNLQPEAMPDPRPWPEEMAEEGYFTSTEAGWFSEWLDRLAPAALAPARRRFLHGDSQATNVIVEADSLRYLCVLDWGNSGWGDPAWDFAGVPLRVVPFMLESYREVAVPDGEETLEARILWRHVQLSLYLLRRDPQPGRSWAERPFGMLLDVVRFFLDGHGERWSRWAPPGA